MPGFKDRIVWASVLAENQGYAFVVVPRPDSEQPHMIFFAAENVTERIFEPISDFQFHLSTGDFIAAGDKFKNLGKQFADIDFGIEMRRRRRHDDDNY